MGIPLSETSVQRLIFSGIVLFLTIIISMAVKRSINVLFDGVKSRLLGEYTTARTHTIRLLLTNVITIVLFLIAILIILSHWDINIVPLLTGASLLGLAISFGAQTLVKDIISGFFIILEDQFSVGDTVKIGDHEGTVEEITLRLTILRDKKNRLIYIPNSQIETVIRSL